MTGGIVVAIAIFAVALILGAGLYTLWVGGDVSRTWSNRLMRFAFSRNSSPFSLSWRYSISPENIEQDDEQNTVRQDLGRPCGASG